MRNAKQQIDILPQGSLRCTSSNGSDQYHIDGKYISKKRKEYAQKVAQREYDEKLIPQLERAISKLKEIEAFYEEGILEKTFGTMCDARKKLVAPLIEPLDIKIKRFMEEEYELSTFEEDDKTEFYTLRSERVRSKSEFTVMNKNSGKKYIWEHLGMMGRKTIADA